MQSNVMDYLQIFFRRKHFFSYPFIITVFIMVALSFILPKTFESTAVILIEEEKVINPLISGLAVSTTVTDRLRILREQILSWKNLTELTSRLKLDADVKSSLGYERLIENLRKHIMVQLKGPQVVMISYQGREPEKVQQVTKTLTEIFIQQNIESQTKETDIAVGFLKDQLKFYRYKIKEGEIKRLRAELDNLLVDSTEKHPLVKNLKSRIAKLQGELERDSGNVKIMPKKSSSNKEILSYLILKELKKDSQGNSILGLEALNGENSAFTTASMQGLPLDVSVNQDIYEMLLRRLETARITKQLDSFKEGTRFTIIDPARLPLKPIKPNKIKFLFLGIIFGAAIGCGCIYLVEMVDRSFKNINDAKAELELPVIGVISAIITEEEFNKKKQGMKVAYTLMSIFFIVMVIIVMVFSSVR